MEQGLIELLEKILSFHAFYKHGHPFEWDGWKADDAGQSEIRSGVCKSYVHIQIWELVSMIVNRLPRQGGYGWKLQKLHELIHIPYQMTMFGSPANWDAGPGESALKTWAKKPAKTLQKRGVAVFNDQVSKCLHESACFWKAK